MIPIAEIFGPTIQGEGPNTGAKAIFVRVMGCDFHCEWCDSKFAWKKDENTKFYTDIDLVTELLDRCDKTHTKHIILTGGNPCLYDFEKVIDILRDNDIIVDIETQGSIFPKWLNKLNLVVISPKAPSSKQPDVFSKVLEFIYDKPIPQVAIKIPVFNDEDLKFAKTYYSLVRDFKFRKADLKLYINVGNTNTSEDGDISKRVLSDYKTLIEKICDSDMENVYVMPQIHTLVWGNRQGV